MKAKKQKGYTFRKFVLDVHLWLGIASAIVLFLVCLSGTVYTFRHEIEELAEPEKYRIAAVDGQQKPVVELIAATEDFTKGKVSRVSFYDDASKPYELQVSKSKEDKRGETFYVNPYSNEVIGSGKGPTTEFFMFIFKMHRWLLLDQEIGRPIVGTATLIFVILTLTGLFLWIPKKIKGWKSFKSGFRIKFSANWKRINHDLHNVLGFYTFLIVLIMALTGLCWSFEWYKDGLSNVLGAKVFGGRDERKPESTPADGKEISLAEALKIAKKELPYTGMTTISLPKGPTGAYEVTKRNEHLLNRSATDKVVIDKYSGKVIQTKLFADQSTGQKIASQIKAIHLGEIYGTFSKIIYFISCLIATSLPVTGIIIWINKLRKKSKKEAIQKA